MATLNELISNFHKIEDEIIENGGEVTDELLNEYDLSKFDLNEKLDNYESFKRYLKSQIDHLKGQESRYYQRRKSLENTVKWLNQSQANAIMEMGQSKVKTAEYTFNVRSSESLKFIPENATLDEKKMFIDIGLGEAVFKPKIAEMKKWYNKIDEKDFPKCLEKVRSKSVAVR